MSTVMAQYSLIRLWQYYDSRMMVNRDTNYNGRLCLQICNHPAITVPHLNEPITETLAVPLRYSGKRAGRLRNFFIRNSRDYLPPSPTHVSSLVEKYASHFHLKLSMQNLNAVKFGKGVGLPAIPFE
jgi:hypothetical protein